MSMFLTFCFTAVLSSSSQVKVAHLDATLFPTPLYYKNRPTGVGLGVEVWDRYMTTSQTLAKLKPLHIPVLRYPGGSYADLYHWRTASATAGMEATIRPHTDFDSFMTMAKILGTEALITVNYGSNPEGTGGAEPSEAAEWATYSKKKYGLRARYWEIGNEVYGNGFYSGKGWEVDLHAPMTGDPSVRKGDPRLGPATYGENVEKFARAIKAVDPKFQVGAVLTCPGGWPDGLSPNWNEETLAKCGDIIDFVAVHWYGNGQTAQTLLHGPREIKEICTKVTKVLRKMCPDRWRKIRLWVTEGDGGGFNTRPEGLLFAADQFASWWEGGAVSMCWWDLHNGLGGQPGKEDDQGMLSNASKANGVSEPPLNTPFPAYFGVWAAREFLTPGKVGFPVECDDPEVIGHMLVDDKGPCKFMIINEAHTPREIELLRLPTKMKWSGSLFSAKARKAVKSGALSTSLKFRMPAQTVLVVEMAR